MREKTGKKTRSVGVKPISGNESSTWLHLKRQGMKKENCLGSICKKSVNNNLLFAMASQSI